MHQGIQGKEVTFKDVLILFFKRFERPYRLQCCFRYRRINMSIRESVELPVGGATFWLWQITLPQQFPLLPQLWC